MGTGAWGQGVFASIEYGVSSIGVDPSWVDPLAGWQAGVRWAVGSAVQQRETGTFAADIRNPANHPLSGFSLSVHHCLEVGLAILGRPRPSRDARPYPMRASGLFHSALALFRVAGGSPRWQVAGIIPSALHSVLNAVLRGRLSLPSYVVTRSRPYPRQTRSARGAAPTQGHALPRYSILHTRYSILDTLITPLPS